MSTPSTEPDEKPHIVLGVHGDLDTLSNRELLSLRNVMRAGQRAINLELRRERRKPWRKWWMSYFRTLWFGFAPVYGAVYWLIAVGGALTALWHEWYMQLAWTILRALWWPW